MPKKGKKGKGKGKKGKKGGKKGGKGKSSDEVGVAGELGDDIFVDKEELLQKELDQLTDDLEAIKNKVDELRKETDWLQLEATKVRTESHEYMSYMEKKTTKRQTTIISLSDANRKEIDDIQAEKEKMLEEFEVVKSALKQQMLEKENALAKTRQQLEDLSEFKELQREQVERIKELERKVMQKRAEHSESMQQLKTDFLTQKKQYQNEADTKIAAMAKQANKEAHLCFNEHTHSIKLENRRLRHELLKLIRQTRSLHEHRRILEEQHKQLLREKQYANDLKKLHSCRQHKVLHAYGVMPDNVEEETMVTLNKDEKELALF